MRELLRRCLEESGYRVLVASNGAEVVSLFKQHADEAALVISDESMPVMSGTKALAAIRALRHDAPVIILSGEAEFASGSSDLPPRVSHLPKPVALDTLLRVVARSLSSH